MFCIQRVVCAVTQVVGSSGKNKIDKTCNTSIKIENKEEKKKPIMKKKLSMIKIITKAMVAKAGTFEKMAVK